MDVQILKQSTLKKTLPQGANKFNKDFELSLI